MIEVNFFKVTENFIFVDLHKAGLAPLSRKYFENIKNNH